MKNKLNKFWQFITDNFIMPKEKKAAIISMNLRRLSQIEQVIFSFGMIMCTVTIIKYSKDFKSHIFEFLYYFGFVLSAIHVMISAIRSTKHTEWAVWKRNSPTYHAVFEILLLSMLYFFVSPNTFTSYTIYINASIIAVVMLAVDPFFYCMVNTFFSIIILSAVLSRHQISISINILITGIIMCGLSLFRWSSLIKEFRLEKIRDAQLESMEKEIELAAFVQESFSQKKMPKLEGYDVSYYSKAMAGVSGDMYDFYTQGRKLKGVGIFDVSGHGISSGLVTMLVRNIIQQEFHQNLNKPLAQVMQIIDRRIKKEKRNIENYLTGILLRMNGDKIEIVNAGHPYPILYKKHEKRCFFFDEERKYTSGVIGLSTIETEFSQTTFSLAKGDELILYTDGVKEALNLEHDEFGSKRIMQSVKNAVKADFNSQIHHILTDMGLFTEEASQNDDITIVILRKK